MPGGLPGCLTSTGPGLTRESAAPRRRGAGPCPWSPHPPAAASLWAPLLLSRSSKITKQPWARPRLPSPAPRRAKGRAADPAHRTSSVPGPRPPARHRRPPGSLDVLVQPLDEPQGAAELVRAPHSESRGSALPVPPPPPLGSHQRLHHPSYVRAAASAAFLSRGCVRVSEPARLIRLWRAPLAAPASEGRLRHPRPFCGAHSRSA